MYERLLKAYREPQRRYHSLQHLRECIAHFDAALELAIHPGEVEIALWFHDAVYDLQAKDNEQRSAAWALDEMTRKGAQGEQTRRVDDLIMATCHSALPVEPDQQLLVDIDLAILGAEPARFAEYDAQVAEEYSWVPAGIYKKQTQAGAAGLSGSRRDLQHPVFQDTF